MTRSKPIGWQEAVATLAGERERAQTCAALLKKHGSDAQVSRGALGYGEAKAEFDAVIAGLIAALAEGKKPKSLPDLEARLERGLKARETFCAEVVTLVKPTEGEKSGLTDILGGGKVLTALIDAVKELVLRWVDEEALTRKTIEAQLKSARWSDFGAIAPLP